MPDDEPPAAEAGPSPALEDAAGTALIGADSRGASVRNRRRSRWPRLLPWLGLGLFAGCLAGLLLGGGPWELFPDRGSALGGRVVVIDPGHGGGDSGAIAQGVREKDLNLDVGLRVARLLEARNVTVRLTRQDDRFIPLEGRVRLANGLPGTVFVSIHFNDAQGEGHANAARASGIETYYSGTKLLTPAPVSFVASLFGRPQPAGNLPPGAAIRAGELLADSIQRSLIEATAAADRGVKEAGLYVTRRVRGPAVLVEGGFVSSPAEARRLQAPAYRQRIADAIAAGIVRYLTLAPGVIGPGSRPPRT